MTTKYLNYLHMTSSTILLAEDSDNDAELTIEALTDSKFANDIVRVRNGAEVLDYINCTGVYVNRDKGLPALIILDIKMPKLTGIEVLEILKKDNNLKTIPIVMLTSSRAEQDLVKSYDLGVNAFVVKPLDFVEFAESIKQLGIFWLLINELPHK